MINWRAVLETHASEWTILVAYWSALSSSSRKVFRSLFSLTSWVRGALPTLASPIPISWAVCRDRRDYLRCAHHPGLTNAPRRCAADHDHAGGDCLD